MIDNILIFLFGMLSGYLIAVIQVAGTLVKKGYKTFDEIEDKNG